MATVQKSDQNIAAALRALPSVDRLLRHPLLSALPPTPLRVEAARQALSAARTAIQAGAAPPSPEALAHEALARYAALDQPSLRPVINATGVIVHTNLGRAPLSDEALAAMRAVAEGYSNLEYDLAAGGRGSRLTHLDGLLQRVTGAEAGMAVNNNASAILLMLSALCAGREVIVSRGQAVEIGGGFRIPDVLRQSGATLVEVGTTNRTRIEDFAAAITERTAALLRVHASNFRIVGFTAFPRLEELAELAHSRGILLLDDLGSGCLFDTTRFGLAPEPRVQDSIRTGVDVAAFSGDKLLGGPQAGILVGRSAAIARLRAHPLARAARMDKLSIAALEATLRHYAHGEEFTAVPVLRMIAASVDELAARAEAWRVACPLPAEVVAAESAVGGGSLPGETLPTRALAVRVAQPDAAAAILRRHTPPVIARVEDGRLLLDPRTVLPREDGTVAAALQHLAAELARGG
jgi:L-seryl-tRNA(Ser) seleniumtransferase